MIIEILAGQAKLTSLAPAYRCRNFTLFTADTCMVPHNLSSTSWTAEPISTQSQASEIDDKCWVNASNSDAKK